VQCLFYFLPVWFLGRGAQEQWTALQERQGKFEGIVFGAWLVVFELVKVQDLRELMMGYDVFISIGSIFPQNIR
jgi:hypothetical protein